MNDMMPEEPDFELEDLKEQANEVGKLSPKEYAKLRGISSVQLIYYHIRRKHLTLEHCICGRRVLDVKLADAFFQTQEEARRARSGLPSLKPGPDSEVRDS
jgi:hypothetical protein